MHKRHMESVAVIICPLEEVARPYLHRQDFQHAFFLEMRVARKRRRFTLAEISEDEPEVVASRVTAYANFFGEGFIFGGLLQTLPRTVVKPAVIHAADAVLLDPASGQLRAPMGAAKSDDVRASTAAAIEGKILAHDANRLCLSGGKIFGAIDRLPEHAHVSSRQRSGCGANQVREAQLSAAFRLLTFSRSHDASRGDAIELRRLFTAPQCR